MRKNTNIKTHQEQSSPTTEKQDRVSARPSSGLFRRAADRTVAPAASAATPDRPIPRHEQIALRAYQLWENQGRPAGTEWENWFEAERQLQAEAR
jgi:hypothetical protein